MAVPVTQLQILRLILQIEQNLNGLQLDFRNNAISWKASATAQNPDVATLAKWMNDAALSYQSRLSWLPELQLNATAWSKAAALWTIIGGTNAEFTSLLAPFNAVANQLGPADKTTYAKIIAVCDQILAAIDAPLSLWPE